MSETITGRCLCGAVTYRAEGEPLTVLLCHCDDCQRQSGAAFSTNVIVESAGLRIEGDSQRTYATVAADGGQARERIFCGDCGSPLVTLMADMENLAVIKSGTLDDRSWLEPKMEIWQSTAQPWVRAESRDERRGFPRALPG